MSISRAVSLSLFQTYQDRPWYRSVAVLVPLPVWTLTYLPPPNVEVPKV
jgi:hypothetical protein